MSVTIVGPASATKKTVTNEVPKYLLVREAGGLGDDIRVSAVGKAIKEKVPKAHITVLGLEHFRDAYNHLVGVDEFIPCQLNLKFRRGRGDTVQDTRYLQKYLGGYDHIVDLFCPAYVYERKELNHVAHERIDMFLQEAGIDSVDLEDPAPKWVVRERERREAELWLSAATDPYKPTIGLHRRSTDASRTYRDDLSLELIHRLYDQGYNVVLFDVVRSLGNNPAVPALHLDIASVAAIIERMDALVAVDSGLLHVAGSLGVPIVGLFGSTEGVVIGKHYNCTPVVPYGYYGEVPSPCGNPCYYRPQRGWSNKCRDTGCYWLNLIHPPLVVDTVSQVLAKRTEETKMSVCSDRRV